MSRNSVTMFGVKLHRVIGDRPMSAVKWVRGLGYTLVLRKDGGVWCSNSNLFKYHYPEKYGNLLIMLGRLGVVSEELVQEHRSIFLEKDKKEKRKNNIIEFTATAHELGITLTAAQKKKLK